MTDVPMSASRHPGLLHAAEGLVAGPRRAPGDQGGAVQEAAVVHLQPPGATARSHLRHGASVLCGVDRAPASPAVAAATASSSETTAREGSPAARGAAFDAVGSRTQPSAAAATSAAPPAPRPLRPAAAARSPAHLSPGTRATCRSGGSRRSHRPGAIIPPRGRRRCSPAGASPTPLHPDPCRPLAGLTGKIRKRRPTGRRSGRAAPCPRTRHPRSASGRRRGSPRRTRPRRGCVTGRRRGRRRRR